MRRSVSLVLMVAVVAPAASVAYAEAPLTLFGHIELHVDKALHLHPKYAGIVRAVFKATGDTVRAGDVLARIENNVGVETYDLTSAIAGVVLERRVAAGQSVDEDVEAFTVADTRVVMAVLTAYPRDLARLTIGQNVAVRIPGSEDVQSAKIVYVSPVLDPRTRTGAVHVTIDNHSGVWRPGRYVLGDVAVPAASVTAPEAGTAVPPSEAPHDHR